jgi:phage terminase large subunit-like protein
MSAVMHTCGTIPEITENGLRAQGYGKVTVEISIVESCLSRAHSRFSWVLGPVTLAPRLTKPADLDIVRYWYLAVTEKTEINDPDWTVGIKLRPRQVRRLLLAGHRAIASQSG